MQYDNNLGIIADYYENQYTSLPNEVTKPKQKVDHIFKNRKDIKEIPNNIRRCSSNQNLHYNEYKTSSIDLKCISNESNSVSSFSKLNEYYSSDSDKMFVNEIKLIPRNKISAFKAFRNSTFKLVSTGASNQTLINNSNNSNRFGGGKCKGFNGSNSNTDPNVAYINKLNKKIMLKKITELANPYHSYQVGILKPFKRIIPHPIIDDKKCRNIFIKPILNDTNDDYPENDMKLDINQNDLSQITLEDEILGNEIKRIPSQLSLKDCADIENYENILLNKLKEIRYLKNRPNIQIDTDTIPNTSDNNSVIVDCSNSSPNNGNEILRSNSIQGKSENNSQINKSKVGINSCDGFNSNKNSTKIIVCEEKLKTNQDFSTYKYQNSKEISVISENKIIISDKSEIKEHQRKKSCDSLNQDTKIRNSNASKTLVSEIEVCIDEYNTYKIPMDNSYIPLYFQYINGKKFKFKLRYLSKIVQAQKAFCNRLSIESLSELRFLTDSGQIINNTDTPHSLNLKPHDIIIVLNGQ